MEISGCAAIVTGAASGLGEATARALAAAGCKVAIFDLNVDRGEQIAAAVGGIFCQVDVTEIESVSAGFLKARSAHGQERILVNCAGIGVAAKTVSRSKADDEIKEFPLAAFEKVMQVNLVGTFRCIVKAAAGMITTEPLKDGERGVIVSTSSIAAIEGQIGQVAYSASKAAIVGMTLPIARDLMNEGVRVNTILPGIFDTPLMNSGSDAVKASLAAGVPFPKRFGAPSEYASLVLEICRNSYLNGEHVRLDGALRMTPR
jgi:NAD(P)-dependent dehydrogenase (short-subunit alcohol dehydrogenase family)